MNLRLAGLALLATLTLPGLARADNPNPDPFGECEGKTKGAACDFGACVEVACPGDPNTTCLYCEEGLEPTTTDPSGTSSGTGSSSGGTTNPTGGPTTGTVTGGTTDVNNPKPDDKAGCACRSDDAGLPALLLAAALLLVRRRR